MKRIRYLFRGICPYLGIKFYRGNCATYNMCPIKEEVLELLKQIEEKNENASQN
jgi:hypothetical protein